MKKSLLVLFAIILALNLNAQKNYSIFFRMPFGEKIFFGMGEMSMEKMIERELYNLPEIYENSNLNEKIVEFDEPLESILGEEFDNLTAILFGNTLLILLEKKKIYLIIE